MKKLLLAFGFVAFGLLSAQENDAFSGEGDIKLNIGANLQSGGTGVITSLDYGMGESFSFGAQAGYLLGVDLNLLNQKAKTEHRFDLKARASAHIGEVIGLPSNIDIYPGLNLGLKNFGAHTGVRYFLGKGFGLFSEVQFPLARFNKSAESYKLLNNQFSFLVGASFDL